MISARMRKPFRDLWHNAPSLVVVSVALAVGICAATALCTAYVTLRLGVQRSFAASKPPNAVLHLASGQTSDAMEAVTASLVELSGVDAADGRATVSARVKTKDRGWKTLLIFVVPDIPSMTTGVIEIVDGAPKNGHILVEKSGARILGVPIGSTVQSKFTGGPAATLRVGGFVHDRGRAPAWMENMVYAFATPKTLAVLGRDALLDEIHVRVEAVDRQAVFDRLVPIRERLAERGVDVERVVVLPYMRHPHQGQMDALLLTLALFGLLIGGLAGILGYSVLSVMIAQQQRWFAVQKVIGATVGQVGSMTLPLIVVPTAAALGPGFWVGLQLGLAYARLTGSLLNVEGTGGDLPWPTIVSFIIALVGPLLLVVSAPVFAASWRSAGETLRRSVGARIGRQPQLTTLVQSVARRSRLAAIAVGDLLSRPRRTVPLVLLLASAASVFMTSLNLENAWLATIEAELSKRRYDLDVTLAGAPRDVVRRTLESNSVVREVELWASASAKAILSNGVTEGFVLVGAAKESTLLMIEVLAGGARADFASGRAEQSSLYPNQTLARTLNVQSGDRLTLQVFGRRTSWVVGDIVYEPSEVPRAYTSVSQLHDLADRHFATRALLRLDGSGGAALSQRARLEESLLDAGVSVRSIRSLNGLFFSYIQHIVLFRRTLVAVAIVIAAVAACGPSLALSLSIRERRREIGILRSVGADASWLTRLFLVEAAVIVLTSWLVAALVSIPITLFLGTWTGREFIQKALRPEWSMAGYFGWLGIITAVSGFAILWPIREASRAPLRAQLSDD